MAELLNLAHMPWWMWFCWVLGLGFAVHQAEKRRVLPTGPVACAISATFLAVVLALTGGLMGLWRASPGMGWLLLAVAAVMLVLDSNRAGWAFVMGVVGASMLLAKLGTAWMTPLASLLLWLSAGSLMWGLVRSSAKPAPPPPLARTTAEWQARLDEPDAQDGADKYTRE
ncbi:hypothetical protein [Ideonella paludis]|uniref:Tryptophan-rich sensory protein n=1 Tax=Ideonella paludis TaxID=1233411 RepID=A0ABS5E0R0_9BURK|nr:hypothetical protein [Ideonella paludis]MBQ0936991.1 hypothetical protein [Ideonella paludis]